MPSVAREQPMPQPQVIDLGSVTPSELEGIWHYEEHWWREHLLWDISHPLAALRRVIERRGVLGKVVRVGTQTVGYAYYVITGNLGILSGLVVAPAWNTPEVGGSLLRTTVDAMRQRGVRRIESPCVSLPSPWLVPVCERAGLQAAWRAFLRVELARMHTSEPSPSLVHFDLLRERHLDEAAAIMQAAYQETVDVRLNLLYRTVEGCSSILENLLQGGCGPLVAEASVFGPLSRAEYWLYRRNGNRPAAGPPRPGRSTARIPASRRGTPACAPLPGPTGSTPLRHAVVDR